MSHSNESGHTNPASFLSNQFIEKPLNIKEVSEYLDLSVSYVYKLTSQSKIPYYKPFGKKLYFLRSELNRWITRSPNKPDYELEQEAINYVMFGRHNDK